MLLPEGLAKWRMNGDVEKMGRLLNAGEVLARNAKLFPDKIGARDLERAMTFRQWNERACRLANGLCGLGLRKGDRVALLGYNCIEWLEIYAATAKAGLIAVPINFRLIAREIRYIVQDCGAKALIVQNSLIGPIEEIRTELDISESNFVVFGARNPIPGYRDYENFLSAAGASEPDVDFSPSDIWSFLYTSGTTGKPKGAMRSHENDAVLHFLSAIGFGFGAQDNGLMVMPMCHANSLFFAFAFTSLGASSFVYSRASFDPEHLLKTLAEGQISFTSLVPTHYIMMLGLPEAVKARHDVARVNRLLISSAPARRETKLGIMEHFRNSKLYELYGSTEGGWVTLLPPDEQLAKLGSIGREWPGTGAIRLLDTDGNEVKQGEVGELYFNSPATFRGYWNLPEKTAEAFRGAWCSVGDLARRDEDGFLHLADRKSNMIISGGENIYPSEVEKVLGQHPKIKDVAVVGVPHSKWGESAHAVVILHDGQSATADEIIGFSKSNLAGYKCPRSVSFIREEEMPRTATGKILHRILREKISLS